MLTNEIEDIGRSVSAAAAAAVCGLDKEVVPMLGKAVLDEMTKELRELTPIPGTAYLHKSNEARLNEKARQLKSPGESIDEKDQTVYELRHTVIFPTGSINLCPKLNFWYR